MKPVVGVAGMTHLGQVTAHALALKDFDVMRFDPVPRGNINEPGLPALGHVSTDAGDLHRCDVVYMLHRCDVVYIAQDIEEGDSELNRLVDAVIPILGAEACLVVLSQVSPGFTRDLTTRTTRRCYYQVDTLITGKAVERALDPKRFIVGCHDPAKLLSLAYYEVLAAFGCPILRMSYESAELAKIAINFMLASQIAAASTLFDAAQHANADWTSIERALRSDARIGQEAYIKPGWVGGHLPRDVDRIGHLVKGEWGSSKFQEAVRSYVKAN